MAIPFLAPARLGANSCTSSQMLERPFQIEIAKRMLGRLEMPHQRFAKRLAKTAGAPPLVDPWLRLQTGQSHLSDAPQCRHRAVAALRATGLISVTPEQ